MGQIEHDPFAAWDDGANLGVEDVGQLGDQLSVAMDDDHFVGTFKVKGETGCCWLIGHRAFSVRIVVWRGAVRKVSHTAAGLERKILRRAAGVASDADGKDATTFVEPLQ